MQLHALRRRRAQLPRLAPQHMVVGDVGELGENGKAADQAQYVFQLQTGEPVHRRRLAARTIFAHHLAADLLNQEIGGIAVALADDLAQQPPQKADGLAVFMVGRGHGKTGYEIVSIE